MAGLASWVTVTAVHEVIKSQVVVGRWVLLVVVLSGFVSMHAIAATDDAGGHHSPLTLSAAVADTSVNDIAVGATADHSAPAVPVQLESSAAGPASDRPGDPAGWHALMVGCVFVLCGLLAGLVLRALRVGLLALAAAPLRFTGHIVGRPERSPPRPIFLSLCVLRL